MRDALSESLYTLLLDLNRQWSQPPMNILRVIRNEYFHLLGDDHIAVDANGVPIARATDRAAVERAAPNAAAYFSGADFAEPAATSPTTATEVHVSAPEPAIVVATAPVSIPPATQVGAIAPKPPILTDEERTAIFNEPSDMFDPEPVEPYPSYVPAPVAAETAPVSIPPIESAGQQDNPNLPTEPYPTYTPADQPPQDSEPVEPVEPFPDPATTAKNSAKPN